MSARQKRGGLSRADRCSGYHQPDDHGLSGHGDDYGNVNDDDDEDLIIDD